MNAILFPDKGKTENILEHLRSGKLPTDDVNIKKILEEAEKTCRGFKKDFDSALAKEITARYYHFLLSHLKKKKELESLISHVEQKAEHKKILEYLAKLDVTVSPAEARLMIADYCRKILPQLEEDIFEIFTPRELKNSFSDKVIKEEFLNYHRTRLTYIPSDHDENLREEQEVQGDSFLGHNRLVFIGDGGTGKTRFFRELEKKLIENIVVDSEEAEYLPIYIEADTFNNNDPDYLASLIKGKLKKALEKDYPNNKIEGFACYLLQHKHLFPLIDAFDQVNPVRLHNVYAMLSDTTLLGEGKCYISTRPYSLNPLLDGIKAKAGKEHKIIRLHPFDKEELERYFKGYYETVAPFIDKLEHEGKERINVVQIPLLARLVKSWL